VAIIISSIRAFGRNFPNQRRTNPFRGPSKRCPSRTVPARDGVAPIELIDGDKLVEMLQNLELGLKPVTTYEIDEAFFGEFKDKPGNHVS
jgi:hypothetical protein